MNKRKNKQVDLKKKIIFSCVILLLMFIIGEWSGRVFISWRDYVKNSPDNTADSNWSHWLIKFEKLKVIDPDIGSFIKTDSKETQTLKEFTCTFESIDLGVDSLRFRDDGIDIERENVLLAVGDSFVWGYGVELDEIFTEVLEDLDKKLDIINAGQIGHTPQQYTRIIKRFLKNDVPFNGVLYNFYSGNDISREYTFREWSRNIKRFPDLASFSYQKTSFVAKNAVEYEIEM